jgi:UDP-N-acetylmuramate dehydrogenase
MAVMTLDDFQKDVSLKDQINFKLGGRAKYFFVAKKKEEIIEAVRLAKQENIPFYILGGGANLLVADEGYEGLVLKISNSEFQISDSIITADAGMLLGDIVELAAKNSLSGIEWAAGIPGEIGGAVYGNAQAFGGNIAQAIKEVEAFDANDLKIKVFNQEECDYSEKTSIFKKNKNLIILSTTLNLQKGKEEEIRKEMEEHFNLRREKHPLSYPSAGSMFVNNPLNPPSSYLIEQAGLKGLRVGDAQVSEKHAGFIINLGNATCKDVLELVSQIQAKIKEKFRIDLEQEVQIIK